MRETTTSQSKLEKIIFFSNKTPS